MTHTSKNADEGVPEKRCHLGRHVGLGAGGAVENSFQNAPLALANPIYNIGLGVSPVLIGIAMALPRIWELFLDPIIGTLSDKTRHRLGRRLPYIIPGLGFSFALFVAMWWAPAGWSKEALGIWLIATSLLFYTAYSFFAIPYAALTIESSQAGPDRIGLMTARTAFAHITNIAINWLYWFCQRDWFPSAVIGMRWVGVVFGLFLLVCGFVVVFTALRSSDRDGSKSASPEERRETVSYRRLLCLAPTRWLLASLLSLMFGFTLVGHLGFYVIAYYSCAGDLKMAALITALKATVSMIVGVLICPIIGWAAKRFGKDVVLRVLLLLGAVSSISMWFLITPVNPYLVIASEIGVSISLVGFWLLMPAYLGDISDYCLAVEGSGCQGNLSALYGIAVKIGASAALLLTGYVLVFCGFHADMPHGEMAGPLVRMRLIFSAFPSFGLVIALLAMSKFRRSLSQRESVRIA